jgi:hypothetical protein
MQGRDLFGAMLRVLGIWFLYQAAYYAIFLTMKLEGQYLNAIPTSQEKLLIGLYLALGFFAIAGADRITSLLYGKAR